MGARHAHDDPRAAIGCDWPEAPRLPPAERSLPGDDSPSPPNPRTHNNDRERAAGAGLGGPSPNPFAGGEAVPTIDGSGGSPCPSWCLGAGAAGTSLLRTEGELGEARPRRGSTPPMGPPPSRTKRRRTGDGVPRQPAREEKTAIATVEWKEFDMPAHVVKHLRTKARFFDTTGQRPKAAGRQRRGGLRAVAFFALCTAMVL